MAENTSQNKDPMVDFVVREFERYESSCSDQFDLCKKVYDQWIGKPPAKSFDWQNQVHVPMMMEAEQTITPKIHSALFPTEAPVDCQAEGGTPQEDANIVKELVQHYFKVSQVSVQAIPALTQCTIYGTGYLESTWLVDKRWQVDELGDRYMALIASRPDCKSVDFFEMYPHPAKRHIQDGLPLIRRRFCDAEFIKSLKDNPQFKLEDLDAALQSESVVKYQSTIVGEDGRPVDLKKREEYEIMEYWGPWDDSYKKDKVVTRKAVPYWITVINRSVKIRGIPNPFNFQHPPFCKIKLFEDAIPGWFGVGIGKIGTPIQDRINKIVNQRLDNVDLVLNKQGFYNGNDPLINTKKLQISKPGLWHKVSDTVTSIRWMDIPEVTSKAYDEEKIAKEDFREATGATVPLMPTDSGQHRTAMGISLLQGAAGARFKPVLARLEIELIQELAMMFLSHLRQFMAKNEWIMTITNDGQQKAIEVSPIQLLAKVKFIPTGISETLNREMQVGQLLRFKEITMNDPTINRLELNRRIAEYLGLKDLSKLFVKQMPIRGDGLLSPEEQMKIQQRVSEGANADQIKMELLGPKPPPPVSEPMLQGAME